MGRRTKWSCLWIAVVLSCNLVLNTDVIANPQEFFFNFIFIFKNYDLEYIVLKVSPEVLKTAVEYLGSRVFRVLDQKV